VCYHCGRYSHPPALGAPGRALFPGRWRDAVFEGPFRRSPGWTEFAEPSSDRALRLLIAGAEAIIHLQSPLLVCASGEHERPTASTSTHSGVHPASPVLDAPSKLARFPFKKDMDGVVVAATCGRCMALSLWSFPYPSKLARYSF
jgi:hypothetical protein